MRVARRVLAIAAFVACLVLGWLFAARHAQPVHVDYLVGTTGEVSLWVALLAASLLGGSVVGGLCLVQLGRLGMLVRRYRKTVRRLEAELHELRNLPLARDDAALPGEPADAPRRPSLSRGG
jgi:uncharacterized integral membrane protein